MARSCTGRGVALARSRSGSSLIEALVAVALVGIALLAAGSLIADGGRRVRAAGRFDEALTLAGAVVAELEGLAFEQLWTLVPDLDDGGTRVGDSERDGWLARWRGRARELPDGRVVVRVTGLDAGGRPAAAEGAAALAVVVRVTWREGARERSVELWSTRL